MRAPAAALAGGAGARAVGGAIVGADVGGHDGGRREHGVGTPVGQDAAPVHRHDPVGDRADERQVVLDHDQAGAGLVTDAADQGASCSTSRWAMPAAGSSSSTTRGWWASRQARSTTRRVPVDSSRTNSDRWSPSSSSSTSWSTRRAIARSLSSALGRWKAADRGSPTSTHRSRATAMVSSTVSDGNRRASWNERPRPRRAARRGQRA